MLKSDKGLDVADYASSILVAYKFTLNRKGEFLIPLETLYGQAG